MQLRTVALILLLTASAFLFPSASAGANTGGTCVQIDQPDGVGGGQRMTVTANIANQFPCTNSGGILSVPAGSSITLNCKQAQFGAATTVLAPDTLTIYLENDNTGFNVNPPTTPIRTVAANACIGTTTTFTIACTTTGAVGGSPAFGIMRLVARQAKVGAPGTYDATSDSANGAWSIIICSFGVTTFGESNPQTTYIGGDTIGVQYQANATAFDSVNIGHANTICGITFNYADDIWTTSVRSRTTTVQGPTNTNWVNGCNMFFEFIFTRTSSVSGFTSVIYAQFSGTLPAGVSQIGASIVFTNPAHTVNRILTPSASPSGCSATLAVINRGQTDSLSCGWHDARGNNVPNNQPVRNFATNDGDRDETCVTHVDGTSGGSGVTSWTATAHADTSCPVTTGAAYHWEMLEYAVGNVGNEAFLWNWGNTTGLFDVSATWHFTNIHDSKTAGGTNVSSFTIGADLQFVQPQGLQDVNNVAKSGIAVSCQRLKPDQSVESTISFGTTDVTGNANEVQTASIAPQGNWKFVCTASSNGNSASFTITFQYVSAFTADQTQAVGWNVTVPVLSNGTVLTNVSVIFRAYDPLTDMPITTFPDDPTDVKLNVECFNSTTQRYSDFLVTRQRMTKNDGAASTSWAWQFYAPAANLSLGCVAFVNANLTARPFLSSEYYILPTVFNGTFYGDGGNLTNISTLTPNQQATVQDMTTFFSTPTTILIPLFLMMAASLFFFMRSENKITSFFFAMIDVVFLFGTVAAKTTFDSIGTIYALLGVLFFAAMTILTLVKAWTAPVAPDG